MIISHILNSQRITYNFKNLKLNALHQLATIA